MATPCDSTETPELLQVTYLLGFHWVSRKANLWYL